MTDSKALEILFKKVDGLDIYLDVFIPESASKENPVPAVLWWHGGGLLQGTRKAVSPHQISSVSKYGLCFISADYRLAPQTRLPEILSDAKSAVEYVQSSSFAEATRSRVDSSRIVLSGSSAGGYLSLLAGTGIGYGACGLTPPPTPKGIAALYPITDLLDNFWTTKQHPVSYLDRVVDEEEVRPFLNPDAEKVAFSAVDSERSIFYSYMVQEAVLQSLLLDGTGIAPDAFSIGPHVRTGKFSVPPTYIVHGSIDDKVPPRQAIDVAEAMEEKGIPIEFEYIEGLDHRFDTDPQYGMEKMYAFIGRVVNA